MALRYGRQHLRYETVFLWISQLINAETLPVFFVGKRFLTTWITTDARETGGKGDSKANVDVFLKSNVERVQKEHRLQQE